MNEENKVPTRKVIRISRVKFIVVLVIILVAALLWYMSSNRYYASNMTAPSVSSIRDISMNSESKSSPDYYPGYSQTSSITDTRELLKTSYSSNIQTRDVPSMITDVKNIVKGADGRIDDYYSSEKSGSIRFVVAKSKFDAFRNEMEAITHKKLYTESISSQNLLTQKQSIEEQTANIENTLASLTKQRDALTLKHNQTINSINAEIVRIQNELNTVRANISMTSDSNILVSLRSQETSLVNQDASQRQRISSENNSYSVQKKNVDNMIANYNSNLVNVNKQDIQFTDNIETVNGSVNIYWISLWSLATLYSPISPVIILIVIIILAWIYLARIGFIPKVEWK